MKKGQRKRIWTPEQKSEIVHKHLDEHISVCKLGKELGVKFVISTDAHDLRSLSHGIYGVWMARKGWLEKADIINCLGYHEFQDILRAKRV